MSLDTDQIIQEIGGGLSAVVIVALAMTVFYLVRWIKEIQTARLADMREANKAHADLTKEVSRTLDALTGTIRDSMR